MNQKGFTLIEILVVMMISSLVIVGVVASMFQISWGIVRTNDQLVALNDINSIVPWLKRDIQFAQYSDLTPEAPPQSSLSLHWLDLSFFSTEESIVHDSDYSLSGTDLLRTYDGMTRTIGRNIASIGFTQDGYKISCSITATGPPEGMEHAKTIIFSVLMRSAEVQ